MFVRGDEARSRLAHGELDPLGEGGLAVQTLTVHVGAVQAAEVTEDELIPHELDHAVLLGDDFVEQLNRVVGVTPQGVFCTELDRAFSIWARQQKARHFCIRLVAGGCPDNPPPRVYPPSMEEALILAIDQGTTGTTAVLLSRGGEVLGKASREFAQHFPKPGWVEHEPAEIWESVVDSLNRALDSVPGSRERLVALGITNQRETILAWDGRSGEPVHRALVWQDRRTSARCEELRAAGHSARVRAVTGLLIDPYFSATKLGWLLDSDPALRRRAEQGQLECGTIDSFLVQKLTGVKQSRIELTNASRTSLLDLRALKWSPEMCELFGIPESILPELVPSAGIVGETRGIPGLPDGLPIAGIAGDQHAALLGQACVNPGQAKCTYGTGAFVLIHSGAAPLASESGLLSTLAWQVNGEASYALEGSAFIAGAAVQWLRDGLGLVEKAEEIEALARRVDSTDGVYFVPALTGLGAPHWDSEARGLICGLTRGTSRAHLARATLEGIAFQVSDLLDAMAADLRSAQRGKLGALRVDGGAAQNDLLLQLQADLSGITVERPTDVESTARGAGLLAAIGVGLYSGVKDAARSLQVEKSFAPQLSREERAARLRGWRQAVARAGSSSASPGGMDPD